MGEMKTAKQNEKVAVPHPTIRIEPKYPIEAAKNGVSGFVVLKFDIQSAGDVDNISIVKSYPQGTFDKTSVTALKQWLYEPSAHGSEDVMVQLDFEIDGPKPQMERIKIKG